MSRKNIVKTLIIVLWIGCFVGGYFISKALGYDLFNQ